MAHQNLKVGEKEVSFVPNGWAEQANGSVLVRLGDTVVLSTATMSEPREGLDFFPLTVEYEERFYAAGKILGSRFVRREGKPTDEAIITARVIDRAIRPLFPKEFRAETQVVNTVLSWDGENDPDVAGLMGSSLALMLSDIPWNGPVAAVRVGKLPDEFVVNPTYEEREASSMDFVAAATEREGQLFMNMIEAESDIVSEEEYKAAWEKAEPELKRQISFQKELASQLGKKKVEVAAADGRQDLEREVAAIVEGRIGEALFPPGGGAGDTSKVEELVREVKERVGEERAKEAASVVDELVDKTVNEGATKLNRRVDGRAMDEIRPLAAQAGVLPRNHGSGLFSRGQTRTLSILTLGTPADHKLLEGMERSGKKRFMHHYNFPPYSTGEAKPMRGPGRREIGHGMLAEKALLPVLPALEDFPYTIRVVSESLSSNGSTSMASTCSSTLALMDAGVPIKAPVAGVAMGIMQDEEGNSRIITDIQGPEDHHGGMDFKVAGTKEGITAVQMDVKILGLTSAQFAQALEGAKAARLQILRDAIDPVLTEPRAELSPWAPKITSVQIPVEKIGEVIGPGGRTIREISGQLSVEIDVEDDGWVYVTSESGEAAQKAVDWVRGLTKEVRVGEMYEGPVTRILNFGAFVQILPGQEGMVHISQLADRRVDKVEDVVTIGKVIPVKVIKVDEQGRIDLSLKEALKTQQHGERTTAESRPGS